MSETLTVPQETPKVELINPKQQEWFDKSEVEWFDDKGQLRPPKTYIDNLQFRIWLRCVSLKDIDNDCNIRAGIVKRCKEDILFFFNTFLWTQDPRKRPSDLPFITWDYEDKFILWILDHIKNGKDCLVEKSRDMGISWSVIGIVIHQWLFNDGFLALLGSKKEDDVDRSGDIRSLFEKARYLIRELPTWMRPYGFDLKRHSNFMKLINPYNSNSITGESSNQDFGRGGRYSCVTPDTIILTDKGLIEFGELTENFEVNFAVNNGKFIKPQAYHKFFKPTYKLTLSNGFILKGAGEHKVLTKEGYKKIEDLKKNDLVKIRAYEDIWGVKNEYPSIFDRKVRYSARRLFDKIEFPKTVNKDVARILGYLVSEGAVSTQSMIQFCQKDIQIVNDYYDCYTRAFKLSPFKREMEHEYKYKTVSGDIKSNISQWTVVERNSIAIREYLYSVGLDRVKAGDKRVPFSVLQSPKHIIKEFLMAIFEGDGSVWVGDKKRLLVTYSSKSLKLIQDIQQLLLIFGVIGCIALDKRRNTYSLKIHNYSAIKFLKEIGFISDRKKKKYEGIEFLYEKFHFKNSNNHFLEVRNIERLENQLVLDVTIPEEHHYITNGIISHNCVMLDEFASMEYADEAWTATSDSAPCRITLSTPKGSGNKFWQLRFKSKIDLFTAHWSMHPEKSKDTIELKTGRKVNSAEAFELWKKGVAISSPWYEAEKNRRLTNDKQSKVDIAQELDIDYIASGDPYFDIPAVTKQAEWIVTEDWLNFDVKNKKVIVGTLTEIDGKIEFRPNKNGWLRLFEKPLASGQYVGALDAAEGLEHGDYSAGAFRDKKTRNLVAGIYGHYDYDELSYYGFLVSRYFNNCLLCAEAGGYGAAVNKRLYDLGANVARAVDLSTGSVVEKEKLGFINSSVSRPTMLADMEAEIRESACELRDVDLKTECLNFINKDGKPQASEGSTDDYIFAFAIAGQLLRFRPYSKELEKSHKKGNKWSSFIPSKNMGYSFKK